MRKHSNLVGRFITQIGLRLAFDVPRRKALLIGIRSGVRVKRSDTSETVISVAPTLKGPHQDVVALRTFLITQGYKSSDVVILMDDPKMDASLQPTHANIMRELDNFTVDQKPGDIFFFGYAGHSYHKKSATDGTRNDPLDTYIIPLDGVDCLKETPEYSKVIFAKVLKEKTCHKSASWESTDSSFGYLSFCLAFKSAAL
ncbi:Metacaspase-4-like protein [Mycena venus]|uniref:Metacaspase-4-like protein n=1 Tax=Mycena venus TaxID=2733690 RepID=A0A8H6X7M2_9AGAR|nr:Metacaspase-4-like protein [Mycena venus]